MDVYDMRTLAIVVFLLLAVIINYIFISRDKKREKIELEGSPNFKPITEDNSVKGDH